MSSYSHSALLDELEMYQPLTDDVNQMKGYLEDLAMAIYLFSLNCDLSSQIRGQILSVDRIPDLQTAFSIGVMNFYMDSYFSSRTVSYGYH